MLINLSNHPSETWLEPQKSAAQAYGTIHDLAFPHIDPAADSQNVAELAADYLERCLELLSQTTKPSEHAIHVMGEMTFVYSFVAQAQAKELRCIASTTIRDVTERDGVKEVRFHFMRFREYPLLLVR